MADQCEKHGPYSVFCRSCDLDTIEAMTSLNPPLEGAENGTVPELPSGDGGPTPLPSYAAFQQQQGALPDIIIEAINAYDGFMADDGCDEHDAYVALSSIMGRMRDRAALYIPAVSAPPAGPLQRVEEGASRDHDPSTFATLPQSLAKGRDEAHVTGWAPFDTAPTDGRPFRAQHEEVMRWLAYKPEGARQMGKPGRWQIHNGFGWDNFPGNPARLSWADLPVAKGEAVAAMQKTDRLDALDTIDLINQDSEGEGT